MSNILGNMPPVFGSGYRGVVPAPSAADVSAQNILRADGTWGAGPSGAIPSQTGNATKLLTTDGTNASWSGAVTVSGSNATVGGNLTVSGVTTSAGISNSGALTFTAAIGQVAGSIAKNATYGLTYYGVTGSSNDNTMLNASGAVVLSNPAGTTNATLAGNLTVSGTGITAGGTDHFVITGSTTAGKDLTATIGNSTGNFLVRDSTGTIAFRVYGDGTKNAFVSGNLLVGTTTDSGNGKLQLATHTTSAGGIGFGTDTSLYRSQTGMLALDGLTGSLSQLDLRVGGVQKAFVAWNGGDFYLGAVVGTTVIKSSNTTALTLDSSQNATFAGGIIGMTQGNVDNISDDGVASFTPLYNRGFIVINNPDYSQNALIAYFKAGSSYLLYSITKSADVTLNNSTTLTGTTGTDGKLNIGYNNSIIYIENRLGGIGNFQRYALGGTN